MIEILDVSHKIDYPLPGTKRCAANENDVPETFPSASEHVAPAPKLLKKDAIMISTEKGDRLLPMSLFTKEIKSLIKEEEPLLPMTEFSVPSHANDSGIKDEYIDDGEDHSNMQGTL